MKTTDLRIGNFIQDQFGDIITVAGLDDIDVYSSECGEISIHSVQPIPLTEQWLLDFGFEETIEGSFIKEFDGSTLIIFIINGVAQPIYKHYSSYSENEIDVVNAVCLLSVEYVHQLQNLYFTLTEEELILKGEALLEGLEAENIEEHKHIVSNWHFLPKLPEVNVEVLIAYKYDKKPIQGYWNGKKWIGSFEIRDYMNDVVVRDATLNVPEYIYAWAELPDCPEAPTPF